MVLIFGNGLAVRHQPIEEGPEIESERLGICGQSNPRIDIKDALGQEKEPTLFDVGVENFHTRVRMTASLNSKISRSRVREEYLSTVHTHSAQFGFDGSHNAELKSRGVAARLHQSNAVNVMGKIFDKILVWGGNRVRPKTARQCSDGAELFQFRHGPKNIDFRLNTRGDAEINTIMGHVSNALDTSIPPESSQSGERRARLAHITTLITTSCFYVPLFRERANDAPQH
ncbi:hypothetical protein [Mycobacterium gastri]|uniref:hypothetical protein n=1 Tax=Mycobacterium gastri TaxID=1777 RepID=UPI001FC9913D|nr:hypothetical protein [Mycobacterium gastri]